MHTNSMTPAIQIQHAEKTYASFRSRVKALKDVSLTVEQGQIAGLIGPNGAGKSTLVKILMTVITPSRVQGTLLGAPIGDKSTLRRVGYLPEHHKFPDYLTAQRVLDLFGAMSGVDLSDRRKRIPELLELVGLSEVGKKTVKQFSKGMRQRLGLAQAMINDPDLLLLDEPTDGVDPEGRRDIREILLALKRQGKTILVNSHILTELQMIVDQAIIINRGQVITSGTIESLTDYNDAMEVTLVPSGAMLASPSQIETWFEALKSHPAATQHNLAPRMSLITPASTGPLTLRIDRTEPASVQALLDLLRLQGCQIHRLIRTRPTLEEAFLMHIQRSEDSAQSSTDMSSHPAPASSTNRGAA